MRDYQDEQIEKRFQEIGADKPANASSPKSMKTRFKPIDSIEFVAMSIPIVSWLVESLIPSASLIILSGYPKAYKTWLTLCIADALCSGKKLFGRFNTVRTNVLYIDEESGQIQLHQRLNLIGHTNLAFKLSLPMLFKLTAESATWLIEYCREHDIKFIIFDSLTRLHNEDENKSGGGMSRVMEDLRRLVLAGIGVMVIHHHRKSGFIKDTAQEIRGSSDIYASADVHISLSRKGVEKVVTVEQTKNRFAEEYPKFELEFKTNEQGFRYFEFIGEPAQPTNSREIAENFIIDLLSREDISRLNQGQIAENCKDILGEKAVAKLLKDMVLAEKLRLVPGPHNTKFYELYEELFYEQTSLA